VFYVVRVNAAVAGLGIDPQRVPANLRQFAQALGKSMGATPQETALMLISQLPLHMHSAADIKVASLWIAEGRIRRDNPAIEEAIHNLGWNL